MRARHYLLAVTLGFIAAAALIVAQRIARDRARAVAIRIAAPPVPAVPRWPAAFTAELARSSGAARQPGAEVGTLGHLAKLYAANGFTGQAAPLLETLRQFEPGNARWPYLLAELRRRDNELVAAASLFETALTLAPGYAPGWLRLGDIQWERGEVVAAERSYVRAANLATLAPRPQFALVRLQAEAGSRGDPRPRLTALARDYPRVREFHEMLAQVWSAAGNREQAAAELRLAMQADRWLDTSDPWLDELAPLGFDAGQLGGIARRRLAEGRPNDAATLLERAVRLAPGDARLRADLATAYARGDRGADARAALQEAVIACPRDTDLFVRLAAALRAERKAAEAAAVARRSLEQWPDCAALHAQLGFALRELGENEAAVPVLQTAVHLDPGAADANYALAYSLLALKRAGEARAAVEAAVAVRPNFAEALVMLGGMAVNAGDLPAAEKVVATLHALQPDDPGSRLLAAGLQLSKGVAAEEAGDLEAAAGHFRAGLTAAPDFAPLLRENGLLAVRRGQFSDAVEMFDRYLRLERRDLRAYLWLGDALYECDRGPEARDMFERGLAAAQKAGDRARITEFSTRLDR